MWLDGKVMTGIHFHDHLSTTAFSASLPYDSLVETWTVPGSSGSGASLCRMIYFSEVALHYPDFLRR